MADTLYPRGQVALGSGDLLDVTSVKITDTNSGKLVHTIRRSPAGVTMGVREASVSFDMVVSEEGAERHYAESIRAGTIRQLRIKLPKETITVEGMFVSRDIELPLDDAIKVSLTFIGRLTSVTT